MKFVGNASELKDLAASAGLKGQWSTAGEELRLQVGKVVVSWWQKTGTVRVQGPTGERQEVEERLQGVLSGDPKPAPKAPRPPTDTDQPRVFVVHGHDEAAREQLELILYKLGLKPFVLANTGGGGLTIIEALEREMKQQAGAPRFGIVLMTPDDFGYAKRDGVEKIQPRARQNVIFEMGMLLGVLDRSRVAVLRKGFMEMPSDTPMIYLLVQRPRQGNSPKARAATPGSQIRYSGQRDQRSLRMTRPAPSSVSP